jgi:hypothetical protein
MGANNLIGVWGLEQTLAEIVNLLLHVRLVIYTD